jgi:sugar transferase (PEP-CTERM/EpsH1 system associated)
VAKVLYLTHRIPYPPDKGDKIATWHILRHLAARHQVYLGSFVDDPEDWQYEAKMRGLCADVLLRPIHPTRRRLRSLSAFLTGESISAVYYRDRPMRDWVERTIREQGIRHAVLYSSPVVQYVAGEDGRGLRRVAHFSDVDSEKWRQYGAARRGPVGWVYRREADKLLAFEARMAGEVEATAFVTEADAELFRKLAPQVADRVGVIENGVDTAYFDPAQPFDDPYPDGGPVIVFTGVMDYWANVDAVQWFATEVLPRVQASLPGARFAIVGSRAGADVQALASRPGVIVTGRVPDVRPYLRHAALSVAPMRIARGTQNKVLEAFSMAKPVLMTSGAAEGLRPAEWLAAQVVDDPARFAELAVEVLRRPAERPSARDYVLANYSWDAHLQRLDRMLQA